MRRLVLLLFAFSAVGFFTARAATFTADPSKLESYRSPVSISVPTTGCPPSFESPILLRTVNGSDVLDPPPPDPTSFDVPQQPRDLDYANRRIDNENSAGEFIQWRSPTVSCNTRLAGRVVLTVHSRFFGPPLLAGFPDLVGRLYSCPPNVGPPGAPCDALTGVSGARVDLGAQELNEIDFGVVDTEVPAGRQLRLKLIAEQRVPSGQLSIIWGYASSNVTDHARIEISP